MKRSTRIVAALAAGICLGLPGTVVAAPTWLAPVDLRQPIPFETSEVRVAIDAAGNALAVWQRYETRGDADAGNDAYVVEAAYRLAGGAFEAPQVVSDNAGNLGAAVPDVVMDAAGRALVVWTQATGVNDAVRIRTRSADGVWGTPKYASPAEAGNSASFVRAAASPNGHVALTWMRFAPASVIGTTGTIDGVFEPPTTLSPEGTVYCPDVAVDPAGNALFAWERDLSGNWLIEARAKPAGATYAATKALTPQRPHAYAECARVALAPDGRGTVVWDFTDDDLDGDGSSGNDGKTETIRAASRTAPGGDFAAGTFGAPSVVPSAEMGNNKHPDVAVDADNTAVVVWLGLSGGQNVVQAASRPSGAGFGNSQTLSAATNTATRPYVAMSPGGEALAMWAGLSGTDAAIQAARRPAGTGTTFGAVDEDIDLLSAPAGGSADVQLYDRPAVDGQGNAVAAWRWTRCVGSTCSFAPRAAGLDAAPPQLRGLLVPGTAIAGQAVGMAVAPLDVWSAFTTTWSFGGGQAATGNAVSHAFAEVGTHTVTVTATDAVGNAASETRTISVVPAPRPPVVTPPRFLASTVAASWIKSKRYTRLRKLTVRNAAKGTTIVVRCSGRGCPFKRKTLKQRADGDRSLTGLFNRTVRRKGKRVRLVAKLRPKARVEVSVTLPGWIGHASRFTMRAGKSPLASRLCLPDGSSTPAKAC